MGVRISYFVLDLLPFEAFIDQSLADALWWYASQQTKIDEPLVVYHYDILLYRAQSEQIELVNLETPPYTRQTLTQEQVYADSFLTTTTIREYFNQSTSNAHFMDWLEHLTVCPWINLLSENYRRWWIGSFLHGAQQTPNDYDQVVTLWQKVLRGYNCGKQLPNSQPSIQFPIMIDDLDYQFGVWTSDEIAHMLRVFDACEGLYFNEPPDIHWSTEPTDWNDWVWKMIGALRQMKDIPYARPTMVSFIG